MSCSALNMVQLRLAGGRRMLLPRRTGVAVVALQIAGGDHSYPCLFFEISWLSAPPRWTLDLEISLIAIYSAHYTLFKRKKQQQ